MEKHQLIRGQSAPEEQIWGKSVRLYEKKLYRDDKIAINLRRTPAQKSIQSEGGYQLHTHGRSYEICYLLQGKFTGYSEHLGEFQSIQGDISIMPPNTKHGLVSVEEDTLILALFMPPPEEKY